MEYLITKILIYLISAFILGFTTSYLFCLPIKRSRNEAAKERDVYQAKLRRIEEEKKSLEDNQQNYQRENKALHSRLNDLQMERDALISQLSSKSRLLAELEEREKQSEYPEYVEEYEHFEEDDKTLLMSDTAEWVEEIASPLEGYHLEEIDGMDAEHINLLHEQGINTTDALLLRSNYESKRKELAETIEREESVIRRWASLADLLRIPGVDARFAVLLEASGIRNIQQLANQDAKTLTDEMRLVNKIEHRVSAPPDEVTVGNWIQQATDLEPIMHL